MYKSLVELVQFTDTEKIQFGVDSVPTVTPWQLLRKKPRV